MIVCIIDQVLKGNDMGLFSADKPEESKPVVQRQSFFTSLLEIFGKILVAVVMFVLNDIVRPCLLFVFGLLGHALDFRRTDNKKLKIIQATACGIIFFGTLLYIYKIPSIRDWLTLAKTHTVNIDNGQNFLFPDRSYFIVDSERKVLSLEQYGGKVFITHTGYQKGVSMPTAKDVCYLLPRGEKISLASKTVPVFAVGFEKEVIYTVTESVMSLTGADYILEFFKHPSHLFKDKEELKHITITHDKSASWEVLQREWWKLWNFENGNKPFEMKALSNEHAVICF